MGPSYLEAPDPGGWHQKSSSLLPYGVIYGHIWSLCGLTLSLFGQKEEKLLILLSDLGPLGQSVGPAGHLFGVVGYQPQLVAAFLMAASTLDPI